MRLNPMTAPIEVFRMGTLGTGTVEVGSLIYSLIVTAAALCWAWCCSAALKKPLWIPCKEGRRWKTRHMHKTSAYPSFRYRA